MLSLLMAFAPVSGCKQLSEAISPPDGEHHLRTIGEKPEDDRPAPHAVALASPPVVAPDLEPEPPLAKLVWHLEKRLACDKDACSREHFDAIGRIPELGQHLTAVIQGRDPVGVRQEAIVIAGLKRLGPALSAVHSQLGSPSMQLKLAACQALTWWDSAGSVQALARALSKERSTQQRECLIRGLAALQKHGSVDVLVNAARSDDRPLALASVEALGYLGAAGALARVARLSRLADTRAHAVRTLGELEGQAAHSALLQVARSKDPAVRRLARSLGRRTSSGRAH